MNHVRTRHVKFSGVTPLVTVRMCALVGPCAPEKSYELTYENITFLKYIPLLIKIAMLT